MQFISFAAIRLATPIGIAWTSVYRGRGVGTSPGVMWHVICVAASE
jgi:hypothetical protein